MSATPACWRDPDWYRVKWNLAAQHTNAVLNAEIPDATHPEKALEHGTELVRAAATTVRSLRRPWVAGPQRDLRRFLAETVEPAAVILLGGVLVALQDASKARTATRAVDDRKTLLSVLEEPPASIAPGPLVRYATSRDHTTYRVSYNAACYLSSLVLHARRRDATADWFRAWAYPDDCDPAARGLGCLQRALRRAPAGKRAELSGWARSDPSLEPLRRADPGRFDELTREAAIRPRHQTFGAPTRPDLDALLRARERERWDIATVQELWAYALRDAKDNPAAWKADMDPGAWVRKLKELTGGA